MAAAAMAALVVMAVAMEAAAVAVEAELARELASLQAHQK